MDRSHELRSDRAWLKNRMNHPDTLFIPCWRSKNFFTHGDISCPAFLSPADLNDLVNEDDVVFLGIEDERPIFAIEMPEKDPRVPERLSRSGKFKNILAVLPMLSGHDYALLSYARGMIAWKQGNRFCGKCGSPTESTNGGHILVCTNPSCKMEHFPRVDPAVIMRICKGEKCLLARQPGWRDGLYSVLAGFVEPGETLEETVMREVWEETGIRVRDIDYFASQPWPFPHSIMIGFTARFESGTLHCQDNELEKVKWFTREEVLGGVKGGRIHLPMKGTIAYRLIQDWLD